MSGIITLLPHTRTAIATFDTIEFGESMTITMISRIIMIAPTRHMYHMMATPIGTLFTTHLLVSWEVSCHCHVYRVLNFKLP